MKKVLIVEDNLVLLELMENLLSKADFEVAAERDGLESLRAVARFAPDMIVLDAVLPGMDGLTIQRKLEEDPLTRHIPILLISGNAQLEQAFVDKANVAGFIQKPFSPAELVSKVRETLKG